MRSDTEAQALNLTDEQRGQVSHLMDRALLPMQAFVDIMEQTQWDYEEPTINPWHFGLVAQALMSHAQTTMFDSLRAEPKEAQDETD